MDLGYLQGCCAVQEIRHLNSSFTPKEAMIKFCKLLWVATPKWNYNLGRYDTPTKVNFSRKVDSHYVFTGVEGYSKGDRYGGRQKYGSEFAAFIVKNKLGQVVESKPKLNRNNHPTHKVAVWIWTPAPTVLKNWYKAQIKAEAKK